MNIFEDNSKKSAPLADRMRPRTLEEFFGQEHIIGKGRLLRRAIRRPNENDSAAMVAHCKEMLSKLLDKVDTLTF